MHAHFTSSLGAIMTVTTAAAMLAMETFSWQRTASLTHVLCLAEGESEAILADTKHSVHALLSEACF